jgi:transposase
MRRPT